MKKFIPFFASMVSALPSFNHSGGACPASGGPPCPKLRAGRRAVPLRGTPCLVIALFASIAFFNGCRQKTDTPPKATETAEALYQCPMHPEIIRHEPGTCPICHMQLQKQEILPHPHSLPPSERGQGEEKQEKNRVSFTLIPQRQQLIGVTFAKVEYKDLEYVIRAAGRIAYDPELYSAIEEYRQTLQTTRQFPKGSSEEAKTLSSSILKSTKMKLRLLGLSDAQIENLANQPSESAIGLVLGKAGGTVWVYADVYEYEVNFVKPGQTMEIRSPALPGEAFTGRVIAIDSVINPMTRTARVRAEVQNPQGKFKPEMYLDVKIRVPLGKKLAIPEEAVLDTGENQVVFVAHPDNTFEPRRIRLGVRAEDFVAVLEGLAAEEKVVASANFLIDSESQFKAAIEAFRKRGGEEETMPQHRH